MTKVIYCHPGAEMYGSDRMALETVRILQERGDDVTVVLPDSGELHTRLREIGADVRIMQIPVIRKEFLRPDKLLQIGWKSIVAMFTVRRLMKSLGAELVMVNTITQPVWIYAARLARKTVVCHVREAEDSLSRPIRAVLVAPLSASDIVVSNSRATERFVRNSAVLPLPHMRVVYNGKDWSGYFRSEPSFEDGVVNMVLVGRISPRKGHDTAIEVLYRLRNRGIDARLRIVGDVFTGYEWYKTELIKTLHDLKIDEYCSFSGFVSDIAGELHNSNIALVPSRAEPFGTVAAESMAAMRCTIVSDVQGLVEIVTDGETGFCLPAEAGELWADAIQGLLADPQAAHEMAARGHSSVHARFSTESYANDINSVMDHAAGLRRVKPSRRVPGMGRSQSGRSRDRASGRRK
jgi:glycosyltransferase involved in cell wall biosynthesis